MTMHDDKGIVSLRKLIGPDDQADENGRSSHGVFRHPTRLDFATKGCRVEAVPSKTAHFAY